MNPFLVLILLMNIYISFSNEVNSIYQTPVVKSLYNWKNYINNNLIIRTRNDYLRLILSYGVNKIKQKINIIKKVMNRNSIFYYNHILSKYYDLSYNFYTMSEDDKTMIEFIISLTY